MDIKTHSICSLSGLALRASSVRKSAELQKEILVTLNTKLLKKTPEGVFFSNWEQVDATRTGVNEILNKKVIDFLVLLIASDNNL